MRARRTTNGFVLVALTALIGALVAVPLSPAAIVQDHARAAPAAAPAQGPPTARDPAPSVQPWSRLACPSAPAGVIPVREARLVAPTARITLPAPVPSLHPGRAALLLPSVRGPPASSSRA